MDTLMDFNDAKRYLKTSRATLYRLIQSNRLPATKMGRQWRFKKERLDKWLEEHENVKEK
ncbi:MAG: helix-turn-helix domain-containing protein [Candidatus Omnitrophota bacterium]